MKQYKSSNSNLTKRIPEVHEGSDPYYWAVVYPDSYKQRTKYTLCCADGSYPDLILDGEFLHEGSKVVCRCCKSSVWRPRMFGSLDVGYELIYECKTCGKSRFRCYTDSYVAEEV